MLYLHFRFRPPNFLRWPWDHVLALRVGAVVAFHAELCARHEVARKRGVGGGVVGVDKHRPDHGVVVYPRHVVASVHNHGLLHRRRVDADCDDVLQCA